jgi:ribosomal protein L11 methyltransferase
MDSEALPRSSATSLATLITDEASARRIGDLFVESFAPDQIAVSLTDAGQGRWRLSLYFRDAPDKKGVRHLAAVAAGPEAGRALRFEVIAAKDWVRESLLDLSPVAVGRFVVHGAHDRAAVPPSRIGIEIEAALAFGTGHHGTTRGCLLALDRLCKTSKCAPRRLLDLGTGTGILTIAAARALHRPVLAIDIDANAVRTARDNAHNNRVGVLASFIRANGAAAPEIRARAPYDLILANILLRPLQCFAAPLKAMLASEGRIILSGIFAWQANAVLTAYRPLALERRIDVDGWSTLVLKRGTRRSRVARGSRSP